MMNTSYKQQLFRKAIDFWFPDVEVLENYRPEWLFGMEIDFFFPAYQVAIEIQGKQHYSFVPAFHKTLADYHAQRYRDKSKFKIMRKRGIKVLAMRGTRGWYVKLRHAFPGRKFRVLPLELREEKERYRKMVHAKRSEWVAIDVKKRGLIPCNDAAKEYMKTHKIE